MACHAGRSSGRRSIISLGPSPIHEGEREALALISPFVGPGPSASSGYLHPFRRELLSHFHTDLLPPRLSGENAFLNDRRLFVEHLATDGGFVEGEELSKLVGAEVTIVDD